MIFADRIIIGAREIFKKWKINNT